MQVDECKGEQIVGGGGAGAPGATEGLYGSRGAKAKGVGVTPKMGIAFPSVGELSSGAWADSVSAMAQVRSACG